MKSIYKLISVSLVLALTLFIGCEDRSELNAPAPPNTGSVSFERFVTLGNSLTAGYQSSSLFQSAQVYSYGAQIAKLVGVKYEQAYMSDPGSGGRIEVGSLSPFSLKVNSSQGAPVNLNYAAPYNNLGIPGAFVYDILNAKSSLTCYTAKVGQPNPLFDVVLRGQGSEFQQAKAQKPTILSCWIGNNDVLGYAASGGVNPITDAAVFGFLYNQLADSLASLNTKVLVGNIPSVTSIPFFTTIPAALRDPSSGAIITLYGQTTTGIRALVPGQDLLTLPASSVLLNASGVPTGVGLSPSKPIPTQFVLDKDEVAKVQTAISTFNGIIQAAATAKGFAFVDFNSFFNNVAANGLNVDGLHLTTAFATGGLFSLDGVHPTNTGYAVVANEYIKKINEKLSGTIPTINVSTVPGSIILSKQVRISKYGIPIIPKGSLDHVLF
jgi:lysophospholipase L1-like esterase